MKKINLNVKGMHCQSCEMLIKDSLEEANGISSVDVSIKAGKVSVEFNDKKVSESRIKTIITKEGFEVV
ncbi:heavy-metal-associated domain-containing protein [Candidatus Woesearchaeota archaeon]|nr:heavy-metal-associated domain-containing protein [Candidatus Woesearchaeota archaeon]